MPSRHLLAFNYSEKIGIDVESINSLLQTELKSVEALTPSIKPASDRVIQTYSDSLQAIRKGLSEKINECYDLLLTHRKNMEFYEESLERFNESYADIIYKLAVRDCAVPKDRFDKDRLPNDCVSSSLGICISWWQKDAGTIRYYVTWDQLAAACMS